MLSTYLPWNKSSKKKIIKNSIIIKKNYNTKLQFLDSNSHYLNSPNPPFSASNYQNNKFWFSISLPTNSSAPILTTHQHLSTPTSTTIKRRPALNPSIDPSSIKISNPSSNKYQPTNKWDSVTWPSPPSVEILSKINSTYSNIQLNYKLEIAVSLVIKISTKEVYPWSNSPSSPAKTILLSSSTTTTSPLSTSLNCSKEIKKQTSWNTLTWPP